MDDDCIDSNGEVTYTKKKRDSADNVPVSVSEEEETQMESEDEEKDSKAAPAPTIKGEEPCVSPPVNEEDNYNEEDNDDDTDENDDNEEDTSINEEEDIFDFDLNSVEGMSEYELMRLQRIRMNEAKLTSLGLLGGMTSTASPSSDRLNRKKHAAPQGDYFVRRVQPKCNVFKPTSYKDLDDPVISKRTCSIDSSDTGEEDTGSTRMDEVENSPSGGDDEEEDDKDELEGYDNDDDGNDDDDKLDR